MKSFVTLFASIVIAQLAGFVGAMSTTTKVATWYMDIVKPEFTPPSWLFGPVWIGLYTLMAIAAWLVWEERKKKKVKKAARIGLVLYAVQLVLNSLWSHLFFGLESPEYAFYEILFLLAAIIATTVYFAKVRKFAAWLMVPYILWVTFAMILNYNIWQLNL